MERAVFAERPDAGLVQPVVDLTATYGGISPFPAMEVLF
jgi:hypothetical protein